MADIFSKDKRSSIMAAIKGKNTKPEMFIRRALHRLGFRYRLHEKKLPGSPDMVFPKYKAVIFVNGCFWHGHVCRKDKLPKTRRSFWLNKFERNRRRDKLNHKEVKRLGWRYLVIWECKVRDSHTIEKIVKFLCS